MKKSLLLSTLVILPFSTAAAGATTLAFYDSFTRSGNLEGSVPDLGGGAYFKVPSGFGSTETAVATGGNAYMEVTSDHSGAFVNFSVRTPVTGLNYVYSPSFYMTATFNASDLSKLYGGHLGVEVGIDVSKSGGGSLVREQQIGLGQSGWYGDLAAEPHTVAWGSGTAFGRHSLGGYTLGNTVTLALKFEEKAMNLPTLQYSYEVFAGVVSSSAEPTWTKIAVEANRPEGYTVEYIGLNVGGIDHGDPIVHSGHIDEIRIGKTWNDVSPVPEPESYAMLLAGLGAIGFAARRQRRHRHACLQTPAISDWPGTIAVPQSPRCAPARSAPPSGPRSPGWS